MKDEDASQDWVAAGLAELATAGVGGVRVEVLAERLGVTKGGFYRRFKERRSLLDAILKTWRDGPSPPSNGRPSRAARRRSTASDR